MESSLILVRYSDVVDQQRQQFVLITSDIHLQFWLAIDGEIMSLQLHKSLGECRSIPEFKAEQPLLRHIPCNIWALTPV
jgi:hypothetical protein